MKLEIHADPPASEADLGRLSDVFAIASKKLDLDKIEGTVELTYGSTRDPVWRLFTLFNNADGATQPHFKDGRVKVLVIDHQGTGQYPVSEILAHELVHVRDVVDGRLKELDNAGGIIEWDGQVYHVLNTDHDSRPWETRAITVAHQIQEEYRAAFPGRD